MEGGGRHNYNQPQASPNFTTSSKLRGGGGGGGGGGGHHNYNQPQAYLALQL